MKLGDLFGKKTEKRITGDSAERIAESTLTFLVKNATGLLLWRQRRAGM